MDVNENGEGSTPEPSWFYDDGVPGNGDRPDYLPEKFKTLADAAKSYSALEKRLGQAPREYDLSKVEDWLDPEFEGIKEMTEYARERHVPQDVFDKIFDTLNGYMDGFAPSVDAEKQKLGDDAANRLEKLGNWISSNFSEEAASAITSGLKTADQVKALEEVRSKMMSNDVNIPTGNESSVPKQDLKSVQNEMSGS